MRRQAFEYRGYQHSMRSRQNRQAYDVHVLCDCRSDDLLGCQANPLVHDLETGISGSNGDLLSTVGVTVQSRFAHQESIRTPSCVGERSHPLRHRIHRGAVRGYRASASGCNRGVDPRGCPVLTEYLSKNRCPFTGGDSRSRARECRLHDVPARLGSSA